MRYLVQHDIAAQFQAGMHHERLTGREACPRGVAPKRVETLPLIVREPQWVRFADRYFHVHREGLYCFWDWGKGRYKLDGVHDRDTPEALSSRRRYSSLILYRGNVPVLLGAVGTLQVQGQRHNSLPFKAKLRQMKRGWISLTCTPVAGLVTELLGVLGARSRLVMGMRVEGRYDRHDVGHSLNEIFDAKSGSWWLADTDLHRFFTRKGHRLSLHEIVELVRRGGDFELEPLTKPGLVGVDASDALNGEFGLYTGMVSLVADESLLKDWYRRKFAVPFIRAADGFWYFRSRNTAERERMLRHSPTFRTLAEKAWHERFYGPVERLLHEKETSA